MEKRENERERDVVRRLTAAVAALLLTATLALGGCAGGVGDDAGAGGHLQFAPVNAVSVDEVPAYQGDPYVTVAGNVPSFSADEIARARQGSFEEYGALDALGRCTYAVACVGVDLMPTGERESISEVHPTGWHSSRYPFVDGESLYNRCHLIAHQLTAENANRENLITGTRTMNTQGMLPFEEFVGDYVRDTGNHVLYRVTPVFSGDELVARGVQMEGYSVEDGGAAVSFNVYCYNVEPGVEIDYATGDNWEAEDADATGATDSSEASGASGDGRNDGRGVGSEASETLSEARGSVIGYEPHPAATPADALYVANAKSHKFHRPTCDGAQSMSEKNRIYTDDARETLIAGGYEPCNACNP